MAKYANPVVLILDEWLLLKPTNAEQTLLIRSKCHQQLPSLFKTAKTVLNKIFISSPIFHWEIYSVSSRTISSKSVISLRPLTCHIPVMPGLMAILALW
jgi:hypothetical protein